MGNNQNFQPLTPQLGIAGSSYQLQMGRVNNFWAIRLVRGKSVLDSKVFNQKGSKPDELPLGKFLTGWVLSVLAIPNINTYQIQKTIGFLRQKALRNFEEQKKAKKSAGKSERESVKLQKIPKNVQIKRSKSSGWIKEDSSEKDAGKKLADQLSPALAASNVSSTGRSEMAVSVKGRKLEKIPRGKGFKMQSFKKLNESDTSGKISHESNIAEIISQIHNSDDIKSILKRLDKLEYTVKTLESDNVELREKINRL